MHDERRPSYLWPDQVVCNTLGISQRTLQRLLKAKVLPPPAGRIRKNGRGWNPAEVDELRSLLETRRNSA